jgi:uncharacterized protein YndB with AHSA1/START domain
MRTTVPNGRTVRDGAARGGDSMSPGRHDGVRAGTGRGREEWFALLDADGAASRPYREIADRLVDDHGLSRWWAQKLTVEYQQARGRRAPGSRPDGTFTVTASKTIAVPAAELFEAFADRRVRRRWLPDVRLRSRGADPPTTIRFDVEDGSRVRVGISAVAPRKSQVALEHARIADGRIVEATKAAWRGRLGELKTLLEA